MVVYKTRHETGRKERNKKSCFYIAGKEIEEKKR